MAIDLVVPSGLWDLKSPGVIASFGSVPLFVLEDSNSFADGKSRIFLKSGDKEREKDRAFVRFLPHIPSGLRLFFFFFLVVFDFELSSCYHGRTKCS